MFLLPRRITGPLTIGFCMLISSLQPVLGEAPSGLLSHQGRIAVDGVYFDSTTAGQLGLFKFALVSANGEELYWCNDGSRETPGEPVNAVELEVTKGLYSLMLGDATLANMSALPDDLFLGNRAVWLRVWFNDSIHGFQQISPDQQFAPAPFAFIAEKANTSVAADSAKNFTDALSGDVTGTQSSTLIAPSVITGKNLEGYQSLSGELSNNDTILSALGKLEGNSVLKAPLASPTFTGTVNGITKSMVELGNVDNTADANKPVSAEQQAALNLKADVTALNTGLALKADQSALNLKAPLASPTFTGTVSGITKSMVGLGSVDNTADANKPVSAEQQAALNLKADVTALNTGLALKADVTALNTGLALKADAIAMETALDEKQAAGSYATLVDGTVPANQLPSYVDDVVEFAEVGNFPEAGEVGKIYVSTTTGKIYRWSGSVYIGIDPSPGSSDAVAEGPGNLYFTAERASAAAPVQSVAGKSGVVTLSKVDVGLGNIDNTADANKPVSAEQQAALNLKADVTALNTGLALKADVTALNAGLALKADQSALNLKAPLASPTFTGTVSGITKSMVELGNVDNTADANKPVSAEQQAALNLKADAAAMETALAGKQAAGSYATLVDGMVPVGQLPLTLDKITAAPVLPVVAWGENNLGQTTVPSLVHVAGIAARESHSLVLLNDGTVVTWGNGAAVPANLESVAAIAAGSLHDLAIKSDGTVIAWGDNTYGQTVVPSGITTATQAAAGEKHSLILLSTGAVTAWGNNSFGQTTVPTAASTNVIAIAAGYDHSLALKADGSVVAWGRNDADQTSVPAGLSNVIAIAAGAYHSLAVTSDGKVVAWGWNNGGQITVPVDLSGVTKVTGGYAFSAALRSDGTLVAWGNNSYSQTTVPASASQVTHLAAGANHMLALRADLIPVQVARLDQDNVFTGRVGIGRTPTTNSLEVAGNASKSIAGSWLSNSDRRIKTDVKSIAGALETLGKVRLVDFRYTEDYLAAHPEIDDKRYPNVIAQEFAEVFPDHVQESGEFLPDGSPILQVDTYPLTIYSAVAVQELHRDSLELRKQNELLRQQLSDQEDRLNKLEELLKSR